jgi:hypothetical protein
MENIKWNPSQKLARTQTVETLINDEAMLLSKFFRDERKNGFQESKYISTFSFFQAYLEQKHSNSKSNILMIKC